jgi:hypothetical protein
MQNELDSQQRMLLWLLLVQPDGEMFLNDTGIKFSPASKRRSLVTWGFIEELKRRKQDGKGRPVAYVRLLDKGWEWCQDHLNEPMPALKSTREVLQGLLQILGDYFRQQDQCGSLGDLVNQARKHPASSEIVAPSVDDRPLKERIREACRAITGGAEGVRIRLADVRTRMTNVETEQLDTMLLQMEREGSISLYRLDNPEEITEADKAAALVTIGGTENHIIYEGGLHS